MDGCLLTFATMVNITIIFFCGDWHISTKILAALAFGVFLCLFSGPFWDSRGVAEEVT